MLFLYLLDTAAHFSLSRSQVWEPLEQTLYGPFCFMVDNGVITGLSRREQKLLLMFDRRGNICCSTPCSKYSHPSGDSQSRRNTPVTGRTTCRTLLTMPSSLPMADFKVFKDTLKEARVPVSGADRSGQHQEFQPSVPCPEAQAGGDRYMRKARVQWVNAPTEGLDILPRAVAGQWLHQSVFNDGSGPNSASHESLLSSIWNL